MTIEKVLAAVAIALVPLPTLASPIAYNFASGNRSANVEFARAGSDLIVTLTNTSTADALVPTDILTAVPIEKDGSPGFSGKSDAEIDSASFPIGPCLVVSAGRHGGAAIDSREVIILTLK